MEVGEKEKERWYCVHFDIQMHTQSAKYGEILRGLRGSNT